MEESPQAMIKVCSKNPQHNVHRSEAKFCHTCGAELVDRPYRRCECGHQLTESQKYCDMCGRKAA